MRSERKHSLSKQKIMLLPQQKPPSETAPIPPLIQLSPNSCSSLTTKHILSKQKGLGNRRTCMTSVLLVFVLVFLFAFFNSSANNRTLSWMKKQWYDQQSLSTSLEQANFTKLMQMKRRLMLFAVKQSSLFKVMSMWTVGARCLNTHAVC